MKQKLWFPPAQKIEPVANGILGLHDNVSPISRPMGQLSFCSNMRRVGVTGATTRDKREILGNRVGNSPILGFGTLYLESGVKRLMTGSGLFWKCYNPATGAWDTMNTAAVSGGLEANAPFNTATFNDMLIITNLENEVMKYDGTDTVSNIADLGGSPPNSPYVATAYKRLFLVDLPHLLYVSDVGDAEIWSGSDSAAIPVNDKDGDEIKWVRMYRSNLQIWKRHSLHELHGPELGRTTGDWAVYNVANIGTPNGKTIAEVGGILYWLSDSRDARGIIRWNGGVPEVISDPVKDTIARINYGAIDKACATSTGDGLYCLAVPVDGATVNNMMIVLDTRDGSWWLWEDWAPTCFTSYRLADDQEVILMGDNDGCVYFL